MNSIDSVVVDKVPVSALMDIYGLQGVVVIEMQNVMVPFNGGLEASRAMPSDVYSASTYERGYYGEGVVIAVLDTGVDNEHRALNDFDDVDDEPDSDATSYNDQKWVAGFDATSSASNPDGTVDPDDGQGTAPRCGNGPWNRRCGTDSHRQRHGSLPRRHQGPHGFGRNELTSLA